MSKRRSAEKQQREKGGKPAVSKYALKRHGPEGPSPEMLFTVKLLDSDGERVNSEDFMTRREALHIFRRPEEQFGGLSVVAALELDGPNVHIERHNQLYAGAS